MVAYIEALLREREGYARYGRKDKVAEVDVELKRAGFTRADAHEGTERAVARAPEKRTARKKP